MNYSSVKYTSGGASAINEVYGALAFLANHKYDICGYRKWCAKYASYPVREGMTPAMAMSIINGAMRTLADTENQPGRLFALFSMTNDVLVSSGKVAIVEQDSDKVQEYSIKSATVADKQGAVVKQLVAETMAYVYTPKKNSVTGPSNFRDSQMAKVGVPVIGTICELNGKLSDDAVTNVNGFYESYSSTSTLASAIQYTSELKESCAKRDVELSTVNFTNSELKMIAGYTPGTMKSITNEASAYKILSIHRSVRGEDTSHISPLTAGYYHVALPSTLCALSWQVADIVHVLRLKKFNSVIIAKDSTMLAHSLAANGYVVYQEATQASVLKATDGIVVGEVIRYLSGVPLTPDIINSSLTVYPTSKGELQYDTNRLTQSCVDRIDAEMRRLKAVNPVMIWSSVSKRVWDICLDSKYFPHYSVHAHAGHVIVTNFQIGDVPDVNVALLRMVNANIIKTHFPLSRYSMRRYDHVVYGFNNVAYASGFRLRLQPHRSKTDKFANLGELDDVGNMNAVEVGTETFFTRVMKDVTYKDSPPVVHFPSPSGVDVKIIAPMVIHNTPDSNAITTATTTNVPSVPPLDDISDLGVLIDDDGTL